MNHIKTPYISEECIKAQRVTLYLNDLKKRIKGIREQHDQLIAHSTEVNHVTESSSEIDNNVERAQNIKMLIQKFEEMKEFSSKTVQTLTPEEQERVNVQLILEEFEKLGNNNMLRESLLNFKLAKDSFKKIEQNLEAISMEMNAATTATVLSEETNGRTHSIVVSNSLRDKINMFERKSIAKENVEIEPNVGDTAVNHVNSDKCTDEKVVDVNDVSDVELVDDSDDSDADADAGVHDECEVIELVPEEDEFKDFDNEIDEI